MEGKTFVIAGGSKGIGMELVRQLIGAGANVYSFSRTQGNLTASEQSRHQIIDFANDPFDESALPNDIHGVAYCPGSINLRSFRALKVEDFVDDLNVNLIGAIKFLKACFSSLKRNGTETPTSVVLFSTVAVAQGMPMHSSVAVSKGAIEGLAKSLAAEWSPHVRVNCLAPALTETPLSEKLLATEEKRNAMAAKYPLKRVGRPADIAAMARFLLSDDSSWLTGQVIGVDGGMSNLSK